MEPTGIYEWPTFKVMTGLFYDRNKFAAHGLQPPTTYDEFWDLLARIDQIDDYRWLVLNNLRQVATALLRVVEWMTSALMVLIALILFAGSIYSQYLVKRKTVEY